MAEDGEKHTLSEEEIAKRQEELLEDFCKERGWDPKKLDATQLTTFYEMPEMKALLERKHRRRN